MHTVAVNLVRNNSILLNQIVMNEATYIECAKSYKYIEGQEQRLSKNRTLAVTFCKLF